MKDLKNRVIVVHRMSLPGTPLEYDEKSLRLIQEMLHQALEDIGFTELVKNRSVLIKPNLVRPNPEFPSATTTDPRVIIAAMRFCRNAGARRIGLGDKPGIGLSCREAEKLLGLQKYQSETDAYFVYFDESEEEWEDNPNAEVGKLVPVPKILREYEVVLNLPKLKLHMHTGISLGIKNLFGLVPEHFRLKHHREDLHRFLVDYLHLVNPDATLIDGIWALEGQAPICGTPVKDFNTLIASRNIVAADAVGTYLMGLLPHEITMIRLAEGDGFGSANLQDLELRGTTLEGIRRHFNRPILSSQNVYPGIDVKVQGACVGCLSSLRHALDRLHLAGYLKEDPQTILLGLRHQSEEIPVKEISGNLWCYGNCCLESFIKYFEGEKDAHLLEGCPPHFMDFYRAYCREMNIKP